MESSGVIELLKRSEAFLSGHFVLASGLHSGNYLQCAAVFRFPDVSETLSRLLVETIHAAGLTFDVVVSPALGGVLLGYEVSRQAGVPNLFAERDAQNRMSLRRGFSVRPGQRVLVVEDVVTTGGSVREVIELVRSAGAALAAVGCVADRSREPVDFGAPLFSLVKLDFPAYSPESCPQCLTGLPFEKPGTKRK